MSTYAEKIDLIHWITELQDVVVLNQIKLIKEQTPVVSPAESLSIKKGMDDIYHGKILSHSQVKKRYEKWL